MTKKVEEYETVVMTPKNKAKKETKSYNLLIAVISIFGLLVVYDAYAINSMTDKYTEAMKEMPSVYMTIESAEKHIAVIDELPDKYCTKRDLIKHSQDTKDTVPRVTVEQYRRDMDLLREDIKEDNMLIRKDIKDNFQETLDLLKNSLVL